MAIGRGSATQLARNMNTVNRPLADFNGDAVVIGCSEHHTFAHNGVPALHQNPADFYSIDFDDRHQADFVFNIQDALPPEFHQRFLLTLVENIDCTAYSEGFRSSSSTPAAAQQGFANLQAMTRDDGFILITGCPRLKEFRTPLQHMKYIECGSGESVLIPKNQALTIQELPVAISALSTSAKETIAQHYSNNNTDDVKFCETPYDQFPIIREEFLVLPHRNSLPPKTHLNKIAITICIIAIILCASIIGAAILFGTWPFIVAAALSVSVVGLLCVYALGGLSDLSRRSVATLSIPPGPSISSTAKIMRSAPARQPQPDDAQLLTPIPPLGQSGQAQSPIILQHTTYTKEPSASP